MRLVGEKEEIYFMAIAVFIDLALLLYKYAPQRLGKLVNKLAVRLHQF